LTDGGVGGLCEVGLGVDAGELGGFDQGVEDRGDDGAAREREP